MELTTVFSLEPRLRMEVWLLLNAVISWTGKNYLMAVWGRRVKVKKVKFTLAQATKAQKGSGGIASTLSLNSALDGVGWSTPRSGRFTTGKDWVPVL